MFDLTRFAWLRHVDLSEQAIHLRRHDGQNLAQISDIRPILCGDLLSSVPPPRLAADQQLGRIAIRHAGRLYVGGRALPP